MRFGELRRGRWLTALLAATDMVGMIRAFVGGICASIDSVRLLRDIVRILGGAFSES